jgi:hypothetical protein
MKNRKPIAVGEQFHFINEKSFFSGKIVLGVFAILEERST